MKCQSGEGTNQEVPREIAKNVFDTPNMTTKINAGFIKIIFMIIFSTRNNIKERNMKKLKYKR